MLSGNEILKGEEGGDESQLTFPRELSYTSYCSKVMLQNLQREYHQKMWYWDIKCWGQKLYKTKEKRFMAFRLHHWRKN